MSVVIGLVLLVSASLCQGQTYQPQTPKTTTYAGGPLGSADVPLTDPRLADSRSANNVDLPEQINLIYQSPSSVVVRWVTGRAHIAAGTPGVVSAASGAGKCGAGLLFCPGINQCYPQGQYNCINNFLCPRGTCLCGSGSNAACYTSQYGCGANGGLTQNPSDNAGFCPATNSTGSIVRYGTGGSTGSTASGTASSYVMNPAVTAGQTYVSGLLHEVQLTGLQPSTQYTYSVGDGVNQSPAQTFSTLQAVSPSFSQYRIGVLADLGLTTNSTMTVEHLAQSNSNAFINIGDFVYADNYNPNAANRWDAWYRYLQQLLASAPMIATEGNHEIERQTDGTTFAAYKARYGNDVSTQGGSGSPFYFSFDVPGAHIISLGAYTDYSTTGPQYQWLQGDLAKVNRAVTPFIIAISHPPVYNTYRSHYKEFECMRQSFEPLLYRYGVDLAMYGHVHAYERTNRVYNYTNNPCGLTHITVGDGGNSEQLQTAYVTDPGSCPAVPTATANPYSVYPSNAFCPTFQAADAGGQSNGYCPPSQPAWSAYREPAFGHGTLDITPTSLVWQWHRNQDGEAVVSDTITINKGSFSGCTNNH